MKQGLLGVLLVVAAAGPAVADDVFTVTTSETSTTTLGGDYVGGAARKATVNVSGTGTVWTVDSGWNNGFTGAKSYWTMTGGADIAVSPAARINNNMSDLIHARDFHVAGTGTGEVIEFDVNFDADLSPDGTPTGGLSTLTVQRATMVTHHSRNLPTIWKYIPGPTLSHHGLLNFTTGPGARWEVRTHDQQYDGGTYWKYGWTLDVEAGRTLTYVDTWHERHEVGADVGFGPYVGTTGTTLTKTGGGTLELAGETGWQADSTLAVDQGIVAFTGYDPALVHTYGYMNGSGQDLAARVALGAACRFLQPSDADAWGIEAFDLTGTGQVGRGTLSVLDDLTCAPTAAVELILTAADLGRTKVTVGGTVAQAGDLVILSDGTAGLGTYDLFGGTLTGGFDLVLPGGWAGSYDDGTGVLTVTALPEPGTLALAALGGVLALVRRRARGA